MLKYRVCHILYKIGQLKIPFSDNREIQCKIIIPFDIYKLQNMFIFRVTLNF